MSQDVQIKYISNSTDLKTTVNELNPKIEQWGLKYNPLFNFWTGAVDDTYPSVSIYRSSGREFILTIRGFFNDPLDKYRFARKLNTLINNVNSDNLWVEEEIPFLYKLLDSNVGAILHNNLSNIYTELNNIFEYYVGNKFLDIH